MTTELTADPVAVITGGGSGIGLAIAQALADQGHRCVLVGRREPVVEAAAAGLEPAGMAVAVDITDGADRDRLIERVLTDHGRIDVVVHAAGVFEKRDVAETDPEFFGDVIDLNLSAVMALTRAAWPALQESSGQLVLVSSIAAVQGFPGNSAYAASKGGLASLGEVLRLEGRPHGIRVITVAPGQTATPIWDGKAPESVLDRMMDAGSVGTFIASLVALDRGIDIEPVVVRPFRDPWVDPGPGPS